MYKQLEIRITQTETKKGKDKKHSIISHRDIDEGDITKIVYNL